MTEFTILMPCLNEADTIGICIKKAKHFLEENEIEGEILISDNGSTDNSVVIAQNEGARVVHVAEKGYGTALKVGIQNAKGKFIIMGDADDSYDFYTLMPFVEKLREGYDLVMGNRFKGGIKKGAMPFIHRYFGNPVLSWVGRVFFKYPIGDFNSGLRGFVKSKILRLNLVTPGMEFAPEMVVKSTIMNYKITEVPIVLHPDGRSRSPHLQTWRDGWRQLIFLLIYSPKGLFFFPSIFFFFLSLIGLLVLMPGTLYVNKIGFDIHSLSIAGATSVISFQLFLFAVFIRIFSINEGLFPAQKKHVLFSKYFTLERGIAIGGLLFTAGLALFIILLIKWNRLDFGPIYDMSNSFRLLIPAITLCSLGIQTIFSSFFIRILNLKNKNSSNEMV